MLPPFAMDARRAVRSRALMFLGVACVMSGLVAGETPALATYVQPAGLLPGMQTAPMAPASLTVPQMPPAAAASAPYVMMQPVDSARAPVPQGQAFMQAMPQAVEPSETNALTSPLAMLFWGLAAGAAMGAAVTKGLVEESVQKSLRPSMTTFLNTAEGSLELGMLPGARAGVPTMTASESPRSSPVRMGVESIAGVGPETGMKVFDPLGLATMGSDKTLRWFQHAEIKHGRVAMAAMVGYLVHINHIHFPGYLSPTFNVSFEELSNMAPFDAWNAMPLLGQLQILWTIAGLEHASECLDPAGHYTKGGTPGNLKFLKNFWDTPGFTKKLTPEQLAEKRLSELKNGRLAMIGIASVCAASAIPGSVPILANAPAITGSAFALPFGTF